MNGPEPVTALYSPSPARPRRSVMLPTFIACVVLALAFGSPATAATINVTTTADELDFIPNTKCSLREAIVTVNEQRSLGVGGCSVRGTLGNADEIVVPAGVYRLTRISFSLFGGIDQDADNLDLLADVTLRGAGAGVTIVDGDALYHQGPHGFTYPLPEGGVLRVDSGVRATVQGLTLRQGWSTRGGGIFVAGALTLRQVAVESNLAEGPGGGIHSTGVLRLDRVAVADNVSLDEVGLPERYGGGIYSSGTLEATNVTISGNSAVVGGGLYITFGSQPVKLSSVTISDNEGVGFPGVLKPASGGVYSDAPAATVQIENTLIAGNRGARGAGPDCSGEFDALAFNLIGDATGCSGFDAIGNQTGTAAAPIDPLLAPLANYGGTTRTHALLPGSPAIDRGPLGIMETCPDTDQRGFARANDGDLNGFLNCDLGAYEAPAGTVRQANLEIFLEDEPDPVGAGDKLRYTVGVRNNGPDTATGVRYALELPAGTVIVTKVLPTECSASGLMISCNLGNLSASERIIHAISVLAPASSGRVLASATVTSTTVDPDRRDDSAKTSTTVVQVNSADLALAIVGPSSVALGAAIGYELTATNAGPRAADANSRVTIFLPTAATFVTASSGCTRADNVVTCPVPGLAAGASQTLNLTVTAPTAPTTVTLSARVAGNSGFDGDTSNNSASWSTGVLAPPPSADLFIQKLGPSAAQVGSDISYNLVVNNNGPDPAEDVRVTDTLPQGVSVVSLPDSCEAGGQTVTCDLGSLELSALVNLPVVVRAPTAAGAITNSAAIENLGGTVDPYPVNNQSSVTTNVTADAPPAGADLALSKSAPLQVVPNAAFEYALVVTNNGPDEAESVAFADSLPAGVTLMSTPAGCLMAERTLSCQLGTLEAGGSATVTVPVRAPEDPMELSNTATVTSSTIDPEPTNDQSTAVTTVTAETPEAPETPETPEAPEAPEAPPTLSLTAHPDAADKVTVAPGTSGVVAMRFVAVAGANEAVKLGSLNVTVARTGSTQAAQATQLAQVDLYLDADDDGVPDSGAVLASGTFTAGGEKLVLAVAEDAPGSTLEAATSSSYVIVVEVADPITPASSAPAAALAALLLAPLALALRRRQAHLVLLALSLCAFGLTSCRTAAPDQPGPPAATVSYQLSLESVAASGGLSGAVAEVTGVPLAGTVIGAKE